MPVNRRAPEPLPQRGQHSWTQCLKALGTLASSKLVPSKERSQQLSKSDELVAKIGPQQQKARLQDRASSFRFLLPITSLA
jgi:hypothetical protein